MSSRLMLAVTVVVASACSQNLTMPANCPELCPGGQPEFRDTVLTALVGLDSSYSGYSSPQDATSLLASSGGGYGQSRAVVKFLPRGDSLLVKDTMRVVTLDSVVIAFTLETRDTTTPNLVLELYRLPRSVDTLASFATVESAMTPERLLGEIPVPNTTFSGAQKLTFVGADLAKVAFAPEDSTKLVVGWRVRASGATGVRLGSMVKGTEAPLFTSYVHVEVADTGLRNQRINRSPSQNFTSVPSQAGTPVGVLPVGGIPAARAFLHFELPPYFRDSVVIVRATLELTTSQPTFGIPGDSAGFEVRAVLADIGPKSPVAGDIFGIVGIGSGMSSIAVEMVSVVKLWQGRSPLPSTIRLGIVPEGSTFLAPLVRSTASQLGGPRLHLTYRPALRFGAM